MKKEIKNEIEQNRFTIQNVPIKSFSNRKDVSNLYSFTIQNVPIK